MKIAKRKNDQRRTAVARKAVNELLHGTPDGEPVCAPDCPKAGTRACSQCCPDIPQMLSSDPERHPLETRIVPLVFELKRLVVFEPCWSCEGHNGPDGKLWKIPRVWFYCSSVTQLRVLANALKEIHLEQHLSTPWHLVVTVADEDNLDTTFSLEPNIGNNTIALSLLQRDIEIIAKNLREVVFSETRKLSRAAH